MAAPVKNVNAQRLLVLSDTHGHVRTLELVFKWAQDCNQSGGINAAVFLGDGASDLTQGASATGFSCEWKLVRGNNDFDFSLPLSDTFDFYGHRFYLCHGHRAALYNGYHTLLAAAQNLHAEAVLFGHTHVPFYNDDNKILLINPGSVGRPRSQIGATFAVIECEPEKPLEVKFWGIGLQGKVKRLTHIP